MFWHYCKKYIAIVDISGIVFFFIELEISEAKLINIVGLCYTQFIYIVKYPANTSY